MKTRATARVVATAAVLLLGASACTTSNYEGGARDTLTILTHYANDPLKSGLQEMVDEWNAANPDLQVETQAVSFDELLQTITVRQTGGEAPDIVHAYSLWGGQLAEANVLAEVPEDVAQDVRDNYSPAAVGSVTVDDRIVGYPTEVQTYGLYYNKRLLAEAGYDAPPSSWEELEEIAAATTKRDDSGNIEVAGFGLTSGWDSAVVHPWVSLLQSAGGRYMNEDGTATAFDSPEGRAALELEKRMIDDGVADPAIDVLKSFPSGTTAMTINAGWWIGSLKTTMGDDYEDIGVAEIPGPEVGDTGSMAYGYFAGVNSRSERQDDAWEFLKWLNGEKGDNGATRMGSFQFSLGTIPGRMADSEALAGTIDDPNFDPFVAALEYAAPEPNGRNGQEMKSSLQGSIEAVWTGQQTVEEALAAAAAAADAALSEG
ncbi:multiple sugar transport system substrate-binding protein [Stackebrandtia albiflava]|uniref:Multiple sugar transport system substrate-binding protein n=1 Tax=Stackebrandtia albiflava TaxID=406432 RepID=A0A562VE46_9ACTN|nr:ABC transporter substrate-binding protein [Stackebrandtia albiflava]TWJ16138.1 multiple sugar transport system substrate-binding protein [Stackebrandtia albiflava]